MIHFLTHTSFPFTLCGLDKKKVDFLFGAIPSRIQAVTCPCCQHLIGRAVKK